MTRRPTLAGTGIKVVVLVLAAITVLGLRAMPTAGLGSPHALVALAVLAPLFALTEVFVLHLNVRRQRRTVSLSEVPLVLGLFFAPPALLVLARVLGSFPTLLLHRRQVGAKLVVNTLLVAAETVTAEVVFRALLPHGAAGPHAWLAGYVAAAAASALSHLTVSGCIALYERALRFGQLLSAGGQGILAALITTTFGLLAATSLAADPRTAFLLVLVCAVLLAGYRAYARLLQNHLELERLYQFSQVLAESPEVDEVLRSLLLQAREMLRAEAAEVTFLPEDGGRGLRVRLTADGALQREVVEDLAAVDPVTAGVVAREAPALLSRAGDATAVAYLVSRGQSEAVLVPLRGDAGVVGTLGVADRPGALGTFDQEDVGLLESVAASAGRALVAGHQRDELRQGALHDPLTGLPNREQVRRELGRACAAGTSFAVLMLDLNGFKAVNDTFGHERGDVLLCDVAGRLRAAVPDAGLVGRLGGDEFVVVLPVGSRAEALVAADRVVEAVCHTVTHGDAAVPVGTALGLALAPEHGLEPALLLRRADTAMYASKRLRAGATPWSAELDGPPLVPVPRDGAADGAAVR